jgi:glycosyltransferase involved in cell wall biosynthesis
VTLSEKPHLSVIIPSFNSGRTIEACLESLRNQATDKIFEIIVVDSSVDAHIERVAERFPGVRLYRFPERQFPGDALNFGIAKANGEILAFIGADCIADSNWVSETLQAHQSGHAVIGDAVDNGNPESYVGWGHYFCEFNQWMPRSSKRQMEDACCLSLKRWAFNRFGPFLEGTYCSDTAFNWRLAKEGHKPFFIPSIKVSHINIDSMKAYLKHEIIHGRSFARVRTLEQHFSVGRRTVFVLLSPLLPLLLFCRTTRRVFKNRIYLKQFLFSLPLVLLGLSFWSWGEFLGYLSKPKKRVSSRVERRRLSA